MVESLTVQSMPPEQHAVAAQSIAALVAPGGTLLVLATTQDEHVEGIEEGTWWRAELTWDDHTPASPS